MLVCPCDPCPKIHSLMSSYEESERPSHSSGPLMAIRDTINIYLPLCNQPQLISQHVSIWGDSSNTAGHVPRTVTMHLSIIQALHSRQHLYSNAKICEVTFEVPHKIFRYKWNHQKNKKRSQCLQVSSRKLTHSTCRFFQRKTPHPEVCECFSSLLPAARHH